LFLVRKRLPTAFVYLYTQCLFLVVLLLLLLSVKLLSAAFAAVSELSDEKFNGPLMLPQLLIECGNSEYNLYLINVMFCMFRDVCYVFLVNVIAFPAARLARSTIGLNGTLSLSSLTIQRHRSATWARVRRPVVATTLQLLSRQSVCVMMFSGGS